MAIVINIATFLPWGYNHFALTSNVGRTVPSTSKCHRKNPLEYCKVISLQLIKKIKIKKKCHRKVNGQT